MRFLPSTVVNFLRRMEDVIEDLRRAWLEFRGRGEYVSVAAIRKAEARVQAEQTILMNWNGMKAHPKRRSKLKKATCACSCHLGPEPPPAIGALEVCCSACFAWHKVRRP